MFGPSNMLLVAISLFTTVCQGFIFPAPPSRASEIAVSKIAWEDVAESEGDPAFFGASPKSKEQADQYTSEELDSLGGDSSFLEGSPKSSLPPPPPPPFTPSPPPQKVSSLSDIDAYADSLVAKGIFFDQDGDLLDATGGDSSFLSPPPPPPLAPTPTPTPTPKTPSPKKKNVWSFAQARDYARSYGFTSQAEHDEYYCPGAYALPRDPVSAYPNSFTSWTDYLGLPSPQLIRISLPILPQPGLFKFASWRTSFLGHGTDALLPKLGELKSLNCRMFEVEDVHSICSAVATLSNCARFEIFLMTRTSLTDSDLNKLKSGISSALSALVDDDNADDDTIRFFQVTNTTESTLHSLTLTACGLHPDSKRLFDPFNSRDSHVLSQIKRSGSVAVGDEDEKGRNLLIEAFNTCRRGGKLARDPQRIPRLKLLKKFGNPPSSPYPDRAEYESIKQEIIASVANIESEYINKLQPRSKSAPANVKLWKINSGLGPPPPEHFQAAEEPTTNGKTFVWDGENDEGAYFD